MALLPGDFLDQVEVGVVMQHGEIVCLGRCRDEQVGDLTTALAAGRQEPLHLSSAFDVHSAGFDELKRLQCIEQVIPLAGSAGRIADFEITDPRSCEMTAHTQRLDYGAYPRLPQPFEHAGVNEMG